jgi:hypothetical protein
MNIFISRLSQITALMTLCVSVFLVLSSCVLGTLSLKDSRIEIIRVKYYDTLYLFSLLAPELFF